MVALAPSGVLSTASCCASSISQFHSHLSKKTLFGSLWCRLPSLPWRKLSRPFTTCDSGSRANQHQTSRRRAEAESSCLLLCPEVRVLQIVHPQLGCEWSYDSYVYNGYLPSMLTTDSMANLVSSNSLEWSCLTMVGPKWTRMFEMVKKPSSLSIVAKWRKEHSDRREQPCARQRASWRWRKRRPSIGRVSVAWCWLVLTPYWSFLRSVLFGVPEFLNFWSICELSWTFRNHCNL